MIIGLLALAGVVALLTIWFYRRTAPLPASLEMLEFMGRRSWRKAALDDRDRQLAALREQVGEVPPETIVGAHPVPIARPVWQPTTTPDDSVADALVALVPPPAPTPPPPAPSLADAHADAPDDAAPDGVEPEHAPPPDAVEPDRAPPPGDLPAAGTLDPHG